MKDCSDCIHFKVDDLFHIPGCKLKKLWFPGNFLLDDFPEAKSCKDYVQEGSFVSS